MSNPIFMDFTLLWTWIPNQVFSTLVIFAHFGLVNKLIFNLILICKSENIYLSNLDYNIILFYDLKYIYQSYFMTSQKNICPSF